MFLFVTRFSIPPSHVFQYRDQGSVLLLTIISSTQRPFSFSTHGTSSSFSLAFNKLESAMDTNTWRNEDSRQKIVNKIMDTLRRHMPHRGPEGMNELKKIALRFEDKIYTQAGSQKDYLQRISLKMLSLESKAIQPSFPGSSPGNSQRSLDSGGMMPAQIRNQPQASGNGLPLPGQPQTQQPLLQQTLQNSISASGKPSSAGLAPPLSSIPMPGISHSSINSSTGQVLPSLLASSQRQLQSRQQQHQHQVVQQHQQSPSQQHQLLYQHQLQHQQAFMKQKLQQQSQIQPSILQQQQLALPQSQPQPSQQSTLQAAQQSGLQSTQQCLLQQSQPSLVQPAQQPGLQQAQQSTVQQPSQTALQQHQQSVLRQQQSQQSVIQQQQQASMFQQSILPPQQQHQQLLVQQNNVSNMQQQQQNQFQQLLQSKHQQTQQTSSSLLQSQSQQLQQQSQQQQHLSQLQSQSQPLQQQQPLLQQSIPAQQELQQRLQTNGGFLQQQQQSSIEQQKQLLQQRGLSEASSTSVESSVVQTGQSTAADWQEKVFQRLQNLKEMYYPEIKELFTKLSLKCQQPMAPDQSEKLKHYRQTLQRMMQYLQVSKSNIPSGFKEDKVDAFEKQIQTILNSFKQRKSAPQQQQVQQQLANQTVSQVQSMQQQPQTKLSQMQQQEKRANQLQQMNLQPSVTSMQSNTVTPIQHGSMSLQQSGVQTSQQNIRTTMQSAANLSSMQGTSVATLQQSSVNHLQNNNIASLQQNNSPFQQNSINSIQQTGINTLQQNNMNTLQHHHHALNQQEILQAQVKVQQQRHIQQQQQLQQRQQQIQQQQQQKQQQAVQLQVECQAQQMPQLQQINELNNDSRTKQSSIKQASMLQHHQLSQRSVYQQQQQQQQLKTGSILSVSSPQLLQAVSPQVSQHSSPQIEQQSLVASSLQVPKIGTPVQPATSPFMAPSPSTLPLPSPHIEDAEKQSSAIPSISNAGSAQGFQQPTPVRNHAQSLAIGTPGISTSPLLADFSPSPAQNTVNQDGHQTVSPGPLMEDKPSTTEPPLERLVKVINSISPKALSSAVNDICSVVSLIDRMAGSAPGDGSRAAAGEDLVAMTKCRLQARNLMSQDGSAATKRMRRCMSSMPLSTAASGGSVTNSLQQHNNVESSEMESTATSNIKRPRLEMKHALQNEIREINHQLIDTVVDVSEDGNDVAAAAAEGTDGIVLKCSYNAIALSPSMKFRYRSSQMTPITPLRLLIPENYPNSSPILLDRAPVEPCKKYEDLSSRAKANFHAAVRTLPQPMSLKVLAKSWDVCARSAVAEYAQQCGGGSFSSKFGAWESCANA